MGQGGQRHTSRVARAWLWSLTPGVGLSAGGARCGQLKQSGVLGLGRKRALAGPDCEWERPCVGFCWADPTGKEESASRWTGLPGLALQLGRGAG